MLRRAQLADVLTSHEAASRQVEAAKQDIHARDMQASPCRAAHRVPVHLVVSDLERNLAKLVAATCLHAATPAHLHHRYDTCSVWKRVAANSILAHPH